MAEQGATYVDILSHYYEGIQVVGSDSVPVERWPEVGTGYVEWPRPPADNGLGIHAGLDLSQEAVARDLSRVQELGLKWVMLVPESEAALKWAASAYWREGIMPVVRPRCKVDEEHDFAGDAKLVKDLGVPAYLQVYNAPEEPSEWTTGRVDMAVFASRWLGQAKVVVEAGGYPGLQLDRPESVRLVLREAEKQGLQHLFRRAWFCCHNYGRNRPARYPYDDINQRGLPVQHPEWEFAGSIDEVNRWRQQGKRPGQDVNGDYDCVLGFLAFARVFEDELGFVPPFIAGETGWIYGDLTDRRYPKVNDFLHSAHHVAMFAWFKDGVLSDGRPLPEYLFAVCPSILSGPDETGAWYGGPHGTREQTIASVVAMPRFARSGGPQEAPAPPSPPSEVPGLPLPSPARPSGQWTMVAERTPRGDGVRAIAGRFPRPGIRLEVTDPWGNAVTVTSGSKAEYGPGGFEVPVWADARYTLRFLSQVFQVDMNREVVVLTFSENAASDGPRADVRLVSDWVDPDRVEALMQGLSRYGTLFTVEKH